MKVFDNMAFGLKMRKVPKEEQKKLVHDAADILGIQDLLERKPKQLSGGQRQRVALGRAIVRKPDVFLFDEPLSNLDAKLRVQMRTELVKLHKRLNSNLHLRDPRSGGGHDHGRPDRRYAGTVSFSRLALPLQLYNHPVNLFVAGFIGSPSMNFLACRIVDENSAVYAATSGFKIKLPEDLAAAAKSASTKDFVLGVRPEDITKQGGRGAD